MAYRKCEMSTHDINTNFPFQVAVIQPREGLYELDKARHAYCKDLSLCQRGHFFRRDGSDWVVFCFAEKAHADMFKTEFSGEDFDPKGKGANWWQLKGVKK